MRMSKEKVTIKKLESTTEVTSLRSYDINNGNIIVDRFFETILNYKRLNDDRDERRRMAVET